MTMETLSQVKDRPFSRLTRDNLATYTIQCLRPGGGSRPALLVIEEGGRRAIVKDYSTSGWLMRTFVGPWLISREERLYRLLSDLPGVPKLIGRLDRQALVVEQIPGKACSEYPDGSLPAEFFERLETLVKNLHARGVVHCDIKNRSNIVVTDQLEPYIIDFASAFTREGCFRLLRRFAFARFQLDDERAVVKARLLVGRLWNEADARFAFHQDPFERAVRKLRNGARWFFKLLVHR